MSKLDDQELDPIVQAALADDPDDDEEEQKRKQEALGLDDETTTTDDDSETTSDDTEDDSADDEAPDEAGVDADEEADEAGSDTGEDEDEVADTDDKVDKPTEAQDDEATDVPTRKEKREARQKAFMEDIYKETAQGQAGPVTPPNYQPLDYSKQDEFKPEDLEHDRAKYGETQFLRGAEEVRYWSEQENFWKELDYENRILKVDPELNFLSDTLPNGKKNPNFEPEKAKDIDDMYLNLVGYKEHYKTDQNGNVLYDQQGQPMKFATVQRTDVSYEKFARRYVEKMKAWADDEAETRTENRIRNISKQNKNRSIRPSGKRKSRIGQLSPGKIANMSDEDLAKYEDQIDDQINSMLGV